MQVGFIYTFGVDQPNEKQGFYATTPRDVSCDLRVFVSGAGVCVCVCVCVCVHACACMRVCMRDEGIKVY